ncbi:MAG: hypothetical protein ACLS4S_09025 [Bacteroides nordii]
MKQLISTIILCGVLCSTFVDYGANGCFFLLFPFAISVGVVSLLALILSALKMNNFRFSLSDGLITIGIPSEEGEDNKGESGESGGNDSWWNRKDYRCEKVICDCIVYKYEAESAKRVEDGKGTVAHAWNCTSCGNCGLL